MSIMNRPLPLLACTLLLAAPAFAQTSDYAGSAAANTFLVDVAGLPTPTSVALPVVADFERVTYDATAKTITFDEYDFQTGAYTYTTTQDFATDGGGTQSLTLTLNFAPATLRVDLGVVCALSPVAGPQFIYTLRNAVIAPFAPSFALTGTYSIAGPTQTATGSFQFPATTADAGTFYAPSFVDVINVPTSLSFLTGYSGNFAASGGQISTTVDGVPVAFALDGVTIAGGGGVPLTAFTAIPEPSAAAAVVAVFAFAAAGLYRWRRMGR